MRKKIQNIFWKHIRENLKRKTGSLSKYTKENEGELPAFSPQTDKASSRDESNHGKERNSLNYWCVSSVVYCLHPRSQGIIFSLAILKKSDVMLKRLLFLFLVFFDQRPLKRHFFRVLGSSTVAVPLARTRARALFLYREKAPWSWGCIALWLETIKFSIEGQQWQLLNYLDTAAEAIAEGKLVTSYTLILPRLLTLSSPIKDSLPLAPKKCSEKVQIVELLLTTTFLEGLGKLEKNSKKSVQIKHSESFLV